MIHVTLLKDGRVHTGGPEMLDAPEPKWVDVEATNPEEMADLARRFGLHRLAVEDALHLDQRPKVEEYQNHLFVVLQGFTCPEDPSKLVMHEMHFFLGPDWLVTVHELSSPAIQVVRKRLEEDPVGTMGRGLDFVVYMAADALVDQSFPILDMLNDELEDLETRIFEEPSPEQMARIFVLKRSLVQLRRVLSPQRDAVALMSRRGLPSIQDRTTLYFRDVYDHLIRVYEQIEAARDVLNNALDAYLSVVANRTNDVTKQLTIIATIFLPLSFVTGFFGQNFEVLSAPPFFWLMLVSVALVPAGLMAWFRSKKWF